MMIPARGRSSVEAWLQWFEALKYTQCRAYLYTTYKFDAADTEALINTARLQVFLHWATLENPLAYFWQTLIINQRDNFERRQTDGFTSRLLKQDLGNLEQMRIWHDNTGEKPGWFLESVTVRNRATGQSWFFPCHRWLALDGDDGLIDRILVPETELTTYEITVVTGNIDSAGTDANVYIWLFGANGDSGERVLDIAGIDNFNRGKTDEFTLAIKDLGDLREVRIRHDNVGEKPGWFLESVTVRNGVTGQSWFFPCHQWLARDAPDGRTDRRLFRR
jgi:hypothetical protein